MCSITSAGSVRCPDGKGQVNRSLAANCAAEPRDRGSSHNCTNRLIARPRRHSRAANRSASAVVRAVSVRSSAQPTSQSINMRASSSPKPRVKDSSRAIPRRIRSFTFDITPLETGWRRKSQASSPHAQFPQADSIRLGQAATYRHRHESARGSPGISPASVTLSRSHCRLARLPGMTSPGVVPILN